MNTLPADFAQHEMGVQPASQKQWQEPSMKKAARERACLRLLFLQGIKPSRIAHPQPAGNRHHFHSPQGMT
jgi:hypothetical protein